MKEWHLEMAVITILLIAIGIYVFNTEINNSQKQTTYTNNITAYELGFRTTDEIKPCMNISDVLQRMYCLGYKEKINHELNRN